MNQPVSATRRLIVIAALTNPFCWLPCVTAAQSALADMKTGRVRGTVFIINSDGARSVVSRATVTLTGPSSSTQTRTDERGSYSFTAVIPGPYQIEAKAPSLIGSHAITLAPGGALDVPVDLKVQAVKQSVAVTANEPALSKESSDETVASRSTVINAPNKYDRFDALLPLIPGIVRGPDGLSNMKGARSSQGGSLVNSASVSDPATGNPAMNLPIDVVESVKVIANPYDPEYGRFTGAVSSVDTTTGNFNAFHLSVQNLLPRLRKRLFLLLLAMVMSAQDSGQQVASANEVVAKMIERDKQRQDALHGYTAARRYVLENTRHHKRAEMLVTVKCLDNGSKQFQTVSVTGWNTARNHVFPKLLESESQASLPEFRDRSRITPENYSFEMVGRDYISGRPTYVIAISPKTQNKYLVQGRIWVDLEDYAIVRIEGKPAKSPSFWIKSVRFVHTYQKSGSFWFPVCDRSVTDVRILGATEVTIEYFDYSANATTLSASREIASGSLP
jgi:hypothetical protein